MCHKMFCATAAVAVLALLFSTAQAEVPKPPLQAAPKIPPQLAPLFTDMNKLLKRLDRIKSYTATLISRERVEGRLGDYRFIFLKFRNKPKSFFMHVLEPPEMKGREVLYVENRDGGKMRIGPPPRQLFGTISLDPESPMATRGTLCPANKLNMRDLVQRAVDYLKKNAAQGASRARWNRGAKINGRACTLCEVDHSSGNERFLLRIFVDNDLQVPIRFDLQSGDARQGQLDYQEEYSFLNVKLDPPLTDRDFDLNNPDYHFVTQPADEAAAKTTDNASQQPDAKKSPVPTDDSTCCCRRRYRRWR